MNKLTKKYFSSLEKESYVRTSPNTTITMEIKKGYGEKWARVTPQRTEDYDKGISNPKRSWQQAATAAKSNYAAGVQASIQKDGFAKGIAKAGDAKWSRKAKEVGVGRFGTGVQAAKVDYEAGFAPYAQVLESTTLPPRFAKGDPRNLERVKTVAMALRAKKVGS